MRSIWSRTYTRFSGNQVFAFQREDIIDNFAFRFEVFKKCIFSSKSERQSAPSDASGLGCPIAIRNCLHKTRNGSERSRKVWPKNAHADTLVRTDKQTHNPPEWIRRISTIEAIFWRPLFVKIFNFWKQAFIILSNDTDSNRLFRYFSKCWRSF